MSKPLYCTGTVRGGTTFFGRLLSANAQVKVASDPFLPLFRELRTEIARAAVAPDFDRNSLLDDYYFSNDKLRLLKAVQAADLDLPFPQSGLVGLIEEVSDRMALGANECLPFAGSLKGDTFRELFKEGHRIIEETYSAADISWCGFKENWIIEFLPLLARAFADARFIVIVRDPRGVMASVLKQGDKDPHLVPLRYSLLRHWRKHAAFAIRHQNDCLFENRLFILRYEDMARDPENTTKSVCAFLDVPYDPNMLDTTRYRGVTEEKWTSWSLFDVPEQGIYTKSVDLWKKYLSSEMVEFVEFICDPEMRLFDYRPTAYEAPLPSDAVMEILVEDDKTCLGWRGDHLPWQQEHAHELFRKQMLRFSPDATTPEMIEFFFLFKEVFDEVRAL